MHARIISNHSRDQPRCSPLSNTSQSHAQQSRLTVVSREAKEEVPRDERT